MNLRLSTVRDWLRLPPGGRDPLVRGYSIDSRTIRPGELFFAVRGSRRDGHDFVEDALGRGAVAAVVARPARPGEIGRRLVVGDPAKALQDLAARARRNWGRPVVAVTGSSGKTTTKDATAALLDAFLPAAKSEGNLNNQFGLPLSILRIPDAARAAALEIGINHPGEMAPLARIAAPDVAVVTNIGAAHLGHYSSLEEIAGEKGRLVAALAEDGVAVLNADDSRVIAMRRLVRGRALTYGIEAAADVRARRLRDLGVDGFRFEVLGREVSSPLGGRHNVYNVLAALAAVRALGLGSQGVADAVAALRPSPMRGEVHRVAGVVLIDDCYNASPPAMEAMLRLLRGTPAARRIAVLGEMRELGGRSRELHRRVGRAVAPAGVDYLVAVGGDAQEIASSAGVPREFCRDAGEAASVLPGLVRPGDAVLLKASRGVGLELARDSLLRMLAARGSGAAGEAGGGTTCCTSS